MPSIKTFVLYKRLGTDMGKPQVFLTFQRAHKEMARQFRASLREYEKGTYEKGETMILANSAVIVTCGDWEEWMIEECDLSVPVSVLKRMVKEATSADKDQMRR